MSVETSSQTNILIPNQKDEKEPQHIPEKEMLISRRKVLKLIPHLIGVAGLVVCGAIDPHSVPAEPTQTTKVPTFKRFRPFPIMDYPAFSHVTT